MSIFHLKCELVESLGTSAKYKFFPDVVMAKGISGIAIINSQDWSYTLLEPSNAEHTGAIASDEGCLIRLLRVIKKDFETSGTWPTDKLFVS